MRWDDGYETLIRSYADLLDDDEVLSPGASLLSLGLDSLTLVQVVVEIEAFYQITFADEAFTEETFESVGSFWQVVEETLAGHGIAPRR